MQLLFLNGAAQVKAVPVAEEAGYKAAFSVLEAAEDIAVVVCDSGELTVQQALRDSVKACLLYTSLHVGQHSVAVGDQGQVLVAHGLVGVLGHGVLAVNILGLLLQALLASIKRSGATVRLLQSVDSILTAVVDGAVQSRCV